MTLKSTWTVESYQELNNSMIRKSFTGEHQILREIFDNIGSDLLGPILTRRLTILDLDFEQELADNLSAAILKEIDDEVVKIFKSKNKV